jgi:manganese-dependent ADP-ribose/CDP-alcohol diphosphatase
LHLLWSYGDRLVLAYIAGHSHGGGYFLDENNIHHLTLHAIIESEPHTNAFATVHVYDKHLLIEGYGRIGTYRIDFEQ